MLSTTKQQAFICKLGQPIATFKKIRLVISAKKISSKNYQHLFGTLLRLADNLNTPMEIFHLKKEKEQIQKMISLISPASNLTLVEFKTLDTVMEEIRRSTTEADFLIVTNERGGSYGWAHGTNLIPRILASKRPKASFVIAYPASDEPDSYLTDIIFSN